MSAGHLTLITATRPASLGKRFTLKPDGTLGKTTAGELVEGEYAVQEFSYVDSLGELLARVGNHQALTASLPLDGSRAGAIVTQAARRTNPDALARTKDCFGFPVGVPGVLVLDYDPPTGGVPLTRDQLWGVLRAVVPRVETAGVVGWCSGSSFIHHGVRELQGLRGQRLYIMVDDLNDTPRFCETLAQKLWLAGYGRVDISSSGQKLLRHIFDDAMVQPARLDFCGGAICDPPLVQRRGAPEVLSGGGFLDTRSALPDLTREEAQRYEALRADAREQAEPEARAARESWKASRVQAGVSALVASGVPVADAHARAERTLVSALGGVLLGDYELVLEDGRRVSVGRVLDERERYHGALCLDPLEPDYLGRKVVGKLYLFGASPVLHSFAHGGASYRLRRQPDRIYLASGRRAEVADEIGRKLAEEDDLFLRGGCLVRYDAGRLVPIRKAAGLAYLVGSRFALFRKGAKGEDVPADLDDGTANMVLASLGVLA